MKTIENIITIALLILLTTVGCSNHISRQFGLDGHILYQNQIGKKGELKIPKYKQRFFYTATNPPKLDSLEENNITYRWDDPLGAIILEKQQESLRSYLAEANQSLAQNY